MKKWIFGRVEFSAFYRGLAFQTSGAIALLLSIFAPCASGQPMVLDSGAVLQGIVEGSLLPADVAQTSSGQAIVVGALKGSADFDPGAGTFVLSGGTNYQVGYVAELNASGGLVWAFTLVSNYVSVDGVTLDADGNFYISGSFAGTVDFDPGAGTTNLTSSTGQSGFFGKYSSAGALIWVKGLNTSNGVVNTPKITVDAAKNVYLSGSYTGTWISIRIS